MLYIPRDDIIMAFLEKSDKISHCPFKGDATYFNITAESGLIKNAAWSYEAPLDSVSAISGYLAFYDDKVTVEKL